MAITLLHQMFRRALSIDYKLEINEIKICLHKSSKMKK